MYRIYILIKLSVVPQNTGRSIVCFMDDYCTVHQTITLENVKNDCLFVKQVFDEYPDSEIKFNEQGGRKYITVTVKSNDKNGLFTGSDQNYAVSKFDQSKKEICQMCLKCTHRQQI